jgi:membrane protein implicated in regulation of membrane protease activity
MTVVLFLLSIVITCGVTACQLKLCGNGGRERSTRGPHAGAFRFIDAVGHTAVVVEAIDAESGGRVKFRGTTWPAMSCRDSLQPGESVAISARSGITLMVERSR